MKYSSELKVGAALLLTVLVFFAGIRFFQALPIFDQGYILHAEFEEAGGLSRGNPVEMKGMNVGTVSGLKLDQEKQLVRVTMRMNEDIQVPEGSNARVAGFSGVTGVRVVIEPGPSNRPPLASGETLSPPPQGTILERLEEQLPGLATKTDSALTETNETMGALSRQLNNPESDLRRTLGALRGTAESLETVAEAEGESVQELLRNLRAVSEDLERFTDERGDSLNVVVDRLNGSLARLERSLASFERTSATLDEMTRKMNRGHGTVGRLLNDPSLYKRLDTTAARTNRILLDFQENPGRFLEDMTLVRMF